MMCLMDDDVQDLIADQYESYLLCGHFSVQLSFNLKDRPGLIWGTWELWDA